MAKEMNVTCDFIQHNLTCTLPENTMDVCFSKYMQDQESTHLERMSIQEL